MNERRRIRRMMKALGFIITLVVVGVIIALSLFFTFRSQGSNDNSITTPTTTPATTPPTSPISSSAPSSCLVSGDGCAFTEDFSSGVDSAKWVVSDNVTNKLPFGNWWSSSRVSISRSTLSLSLAPAAHPIFNTTFAGAQVRSRGWFTNGCFEASIRAANTPGIVSAFFLYTGEFDAAPGGSGKHNEIDFEFVWREPRNMTVLQTNFFTEDGAQNAQLLPVSFDVNAAFHTYSIRWLDSSIAWFVDGQSVRVVSNNVTQSDATDVVPSVSEGGPMRLFVNLWTPSNMTPSTQKWAGRYEHEGSEQNPTTVFDWVRFTPGDNCLF